jgi:hypothetical protein
VGDDDFIARTEATIKLICDDNGTLIIDQSFGIDEDPESTNRGGLDITDVSFDNHEGTIVFFFKIVSDPSTIAIGVKIVEFSLSSGGGSGRGSVGFDLSEGSKPTLSPSSDRPLKCDNCDGIIGEYPPIPFLGNPSNIFNSAELYFVPSVTSR